jgi:hypothetical protein
MHRRELGIDHDHRVVAGGDRDVAADPFEHEGPIAERGHLDLRLRKIRLSWRRWCGRLLRNSLHGNLGGGRRNRCDLHGLFSGVDIVLEWTTPDAGSLFAAFDARRMLFR